MSSRENGWRFGLLLLALSAGWLGTSWLGAQVGADSITRRSASTPAPAQQAPQARNGVVQTTPPPP